MHHLQASVQTLSVAPTPLAGPVILGPQRLLLRHQLLFLRKRLPRASGRTRRRGRGCTRCAAGAGRGRAARVPVAQAKLRLRDGLGPSEGPRPTGQQVGEDADAGAGGR